MTAEPMIDVETELARLAGAFPPNDIEARYEAALRALADARVEIERLREQKDCDTATFRNLQQEHSASKAKLWAEIERKDAALREAAETFVYYADLHRAKGTEEGEAKAEANAHTARLMLAALNPVANPTGEA